MAYAESGDQICWYVRFLVTQRALTESSRLFNVHRSHSEWSSDFQAVPCCRDQTIPSDVGQHSNRSYVLCSTLLPTFYSILIGVSSHTTLTCSYLHPSRVVRLRCYTPSYLGLTGMLIHSRAGNENGSGLGGHQSTGTLPLPPVLSLDILSGDPDPR